MPAEPQDDVLPLVKLRQVLALCEDQQLGCAFGLTKDKKDCLLLVEKRGKPKAIATALKTQGKAHLDPKTLRFGHVTVDPVNDPGTLKFTVNRMEAGGTIMTLNKLAKRAGYQAIVINADAALDEEAEGEGGPPAPPPPPSAAAPDTEALRSRLTELIEQMTERLPKDPANAEQMQKLAKAANIQLSTNNFKTATTLMDGLAKILGTPLPSADGSSDAALDKMRQAHRAMGAALKQAAGTSAATAGAIADHEAAFEAALAEGDPAAAREALFELAALSKRVAASNDGARAGLVEFAKMRLDWEDAKKSVAAKLAVLAREIDDDDTDEESSDLFAAATKKLDRVLTQFNEGLGKLVGDLAEAANDDKRKVAAAAASKIADKYLGYLSGSALVEHIDANPYGVSVDAQNTLAAPLEALKSRLKSVA